MEFIKACIAFVFLILSPCAYAMTFAAQDDSLGYTISYLKSKKQLTSEQVVPGQYDSDFTQFNSSDKLDEHKLIWLRINFKNETRHMGWAMVLGS